MKRTSGLALLLLAERGIYWAVGITLVLGAAILLGHTAWVTVLGLLEGDYAATVLRMFDRALLALMLAQIVFTTLSFLREGILQLEPVLVVGVIAVVRRILVVTAVVGGTLQAESGITQTFDEIMLELGLLALTVLVLAVAVYLVRRRPARPSGEGLLSSRDRSPEPHT